MKLRSWYATMWYTPTWRYATMWYTRRIVFNRISEQRRKRLKELEEQITQLKKKMNEQNKMLKLKEKSDQRCKQLHNDISVSLTHQSVLIYRQAGIVNAAVNGHLELTLLKSHQRFNAISTSNLEVYQFWDWWIFTYFIFGRGESLPNNIWSTVNLERTCVLLFYYILYLKVNLDIEKTNRLGESSPNFIFAAMNLGPIILEKRWINGESWPNDFVEKVNRGEDLWWVGSKCPLTCA